MNERTKLMPRKAMKCQAFNNFQKKNRERLAPAPFTEALRESFESAQYAKAC